RIDAEAGAILHGTRTIVRGARRDQRELALACLPHDPAGSAHYDTAVRDVTAGRHQRACGDHAMAADARVVEHHRAVADQRIVGDRAAVQQRAMTDRDAGADVRRLAFVGVDDRAVLHVRAGTDRYPVAVAAQHGPKPHARARPQTHTADDLRARRDIPVVA